MGNWRNQRGNKKVLRSNENISSNSMGSRKSCSKKEVYSDTSLTQETRKISNRTLHLNELEKRNKTQS